MQPYFSIPETKQHLLTASGSLMVGSPDTVRYRLGHVLRIIANGPEMFDTHCEVNIEWMGSRLKEKLSEVRADSKGSDIDVLVYMFYRVIREFQFSIAQEISPELGAFLEIVDKFCHEMSGEAQRNIEYARHAMQISILKHLIHSERYGPLTSVSSLSANIASRIEKWKGEIEKTEERAAELAKALSNQEQEFNFVGLSKGFADLADSITKELVFARYGLIIFGALMMLPSIVDLWLITMRNVDVSKLGNYTLGAVLVSTITLTLLFLYFFRITLRKADSCRAQLVQIRLRMSLCKFIQSYADYSVEIKAKNGDALSKFEALIFSGIVGTEDKLPSTFDGIEQLSALAKTIRG